MWGGNVGGYSSDENIGVVCTRREEGWAGRPGKGSVGRGSWSLTEENMEEKYGGGVEQVSTVRSAGAR